MEPKKEVQVWLSIELVMFLVHSRARELIFDDDHTRNTSQTLPFTPSKAQPANEQSFPVNTRVEDQKHTSNKKMLF